MSVTEEPESVAVLARPSSVVASDDDDRNRI